jgi:ADP-heptose:LPS heptosyltransferase
VGVGAARREGAPVNLSFAKAVDRYAGVAVGAVLVGLRGLREFVAPREDLVEAHTILLVKFWGLGNIVLLLPVVRLLRERYPAARIVFVSLARNRELLDACPHLDERIYVDDRNALALAVSLLRAALRARRASPDLAIDFEQFARSSAILAVCARSRQIVGLATPGQGRTALYHKRVRYDDRQHMSQTYLDLARAAGVAERLYRPERVPVSDAARVEAQTLLGACADSAARPLVVLHPGSGDNFQGRRWPVASFARLAQRLVREERALVVVTGSRAESALTRDVVAAAGEPGAVLDAAGRLSVLGLAALIDRAALVVANDTAPVHLASSLGVPVLGFYGPNTPRLYGPLSRDSFAFFRALPCSPCLTNMNYKTSHCRMPVCIQDIGVDEAADRARTILAQRRAAAVLRGSARA